MQRGQALVLVMMVLSVALTVGLSIATRSTNEVKISSAQEESARALEAAEAGLEKALGGTLEGTQVSLGSSGATYVVAPTPTSGAKLSEWIIPFQLVEGQAATVDMRNYDQILATEPNRMRFCWGANGSSVVTKLQVDLYYKLTSGVIRIGKVFYDPAVTTYTTGVNQCPNALNAKYTYKADFNDFNIPSGAQLLLFRLKLLGNGVNSEPVGIKSPGGDFGRQGYEYTSVGSAGTATQKVRGVDLNYDLPMMFDNAVFSGTTLNKI